MKTLWMRLGGLVASLALMATAFDVNATCTFAVHQPKIPTGAEKLRKF